MWGAARPPVIFLKRTFFDGSSRYEDYSSHLSGCNPDPCHLLQTRFPTLSPKYSFSVPQLCDLPCCPQPRALFKLVCLECPLLPRSFRGTPIQQLLCMLITPLCQHSRHLFLVAISACIKGTRDQTHSPGSSLTSL